MKIKRILLVFISVLFFTSCSQNQDEVMVKAINFSKENDMYSLEFIAYDFSNKSESYTEYIFTDSNYDKAFISAENKYNLNLSLCDYAFISSSVVSDNKMNLVLKALEEFGVNSDTNLVLSDDVSKDNYTDLKEKNLKITPIYSILNKKDETNFILPVLNKDLYISSAVIINNDGALSNLSNEELNIALLLLAGNKDFNYNFNNSNDSADIRNGFAYFNMENNILEITTYLDIKSRNGATNSKTSSNAFDTLLIYDIQSKIYDLFNDQIIRTTLNLDWVEKQYNQEIDDINVVVKILQNKD